MLVLDTVDSTNTELARRVRSGSAVDGDALRAQHQVAGRGRAGRSFVDDGGSLLVSVYRDLPASAMDHIGWVTMASALAMVEAVDEIAPGLTTLTWPNDLHVGEKKLGGVLGEILDVGASVPIIVGCGINVSSTPDVAGATSLAEAGVDLSINAVELLSRSYVAHLAEAMAHVAAGTTAGLRERVLDLCTTIGTEVTLVDLAGASRRGTATDIDADGSLILTTEAGPIPFTGVDVLR